jgi:RHS repeat-associated protein
VKVTEKDDEGTVLSIAEYAYDVNDRRIVKIADSDGPGSTPAVDTIFSWEDDQIALQFDGSSAVAHRYLYGPYVDQLLADETVTSTSTPGGIIWSLADHLGTLADLATHDSSTHQTDIENHRTFDSYGTITAETNPAIDLLFAFTGRERDDETGLQYNRARYYDSAVGLWISQDPIGFSARDPNLARYVNNTPIDNIDPSGLIITGPFDGGLTGNGLFWPSTVGGSVLVAATILAGVEPTPIGEFCLVAALAVVGTGVILAGADIEFIDWLQKKHGLSDEAREILHEEITGQNLTREEIEEVVELIKELYPGKVTPPETPPPSIPFNGGGGFFP